MIAMSISMTVSLACDVVDTATADASAGASSLVAERCLARFRLIDAS